MILYADRGDQRKSQSLHREHRVHPAIFADRGDRRIKSPSVSLSFVGGSRDKCYITKKDLETTSVFMIRFHFHEFTVYGIIPFERRGFESLVKQKGEN